MKVEVSAETYQVGAHSKALIKAILVASSRVLEDFFHFMFPCRAVGEITMPSHPCPENQEAPTKILGLLTCIFPAGSSFRNCEVSPLVVGLTLTTPRRSRPSSVKVPVLSKQTQLTLPDTLMVRGLMQNMPLPEGDKTPI